MNELPVIKSLCLGIDFWDCHGRKHCNLARGKSMAKGCSDIQIYYLEEIIAFLALFYQKWIWVMLQHGKCKFLFEQP